MYRNTNRKSQKLFPLFKKGRKNTKCIKFPQKYSIFSPENANFICEDCFQGKNESLDAIFGGHLVRWLSMPVIISQFPLISSPLSDGTAVVSWSQFSLSIQCT